MIEARSEPEKAPLVQIGWLLAADDRDPAFVVACTEARERLTSLLGREFPEFRWEMPTVNRRQFPPPAER